jgi:CHASE2 domain-containing sensor protein
VAPCDPPGLLRAIVFIDLVGLDEGAARDRLVEGVRGERAKPEAPPAFPGEAGPRPAFPGGAVAPAEAPPSPSRRRKVARALFAYAATTGLVFLASWTGLLNLLGVDDWMERRFLAHVRRYLHPPRVEDVVLVRGADDGGPFGKPGPAWRRHYADMVKLLSEAGARVIVFDLYFEDPSEHDASLVEAIRQAEGRRTAVVLGARSFRQGGTSPRPNISPVLADLPVCWGTLGGDAAQRRIELGRPLEGAAPSHPSLRVEALPVVPSLALQAVMQYDAQGDRPASARLRLGEDVVEVQAGARRRRIPVLDSRLGFIVDVAAPSAFWSPSYQSVLTRSGDPKAVADVAGKIVVIGFETPEEVWSDADGRARYGMEIQASAIAQILGGSFLLRPRAAAQYGSILLTGAVGWLLRTRLALFRRSFKLSLPAMGRPVEINPAFLVFLAAYALLAFAACKVWRMVPRISYDLAALFLTYLAVGWATREPFGVPLAARLRALGPGRRGDGNGR